MEVTSERYMPTDALKSKIDIEHSPQHLAVKVSVKNKIVTAAAASTDYGVKINAEAVSFAARPFPPQPADLSHQ